MRICSPCCGAAPETRSGGEAYERDVLAGLVAAGDAPHIPIAGGKVVARVLASRVERVRPRRGLRWWAMPWVMVPAILRCWRRHGFDLLRCHSPLYLGPACLLAQRLGVRAPLVVHIHHLDEDERARTRLEIAVARRADLVVTDSAWSAGRLVAHGLDRAKLRVVHCGVSDLYRPAPIRTWAGGVIVAVGPLIPRKRPLELIRIVAAIPASVGPRLLVWLGEGPLGPAAMAEAQRLGVSFSWLRTWSDDAKRALFSVATVFAHAATVEGFPLAPLEAMGCGVPVVAFDAGPMPEMVVDGDEGILCEDTDIFQRVLAAVLAQPHDAELMGQFAAKKVEERFRTSHMVAGLRAVYAEAVA